MTVEITRDHNTQTFTGIANEEGDVFRCAAEEIKALGETNQVPSEFLLKVQDVPGRVVFKLARRGTWIDENGMERPALHVTGSGWIGGLQASDYKPVLFRCVNGNTNRATGERANNYKEYALIPLPDGKLTAFYGRIGSQAGDRFGMRQLKTPYEGYMYWPLVAEKLSKGYVDVTDLVDMKPLLKLAGVPVADRPAAADPQPKGGTVTATAPQTPSAALYALLKGFARGFVAHHLADGVKIRPTRQLIEKGWAVWKEMCASTEAEDFNRRVAVLAALSPRRMDQTAELFAASPSDFRRILNREESLLQAMQAMIDGTPEEATASDFSARGIEVYEATDAQKEEVLKHLSDALKPKVKRVYRVIPKAQQTAFNQYLKASGKAGKPLAVRQLWHGSRNENWFTILTDGLKLHPNARITGKMLGDGIYFAPSSAKSWNYTSYAGTYWAHGSADTAFMGLYATAYGTPREIHDAADIRNYDQSGLDAGGFSCVHAFPDCGLRNDEIVFYRENAVVLNYLVEFGS